LGFSSGLGDVQPPLYDKVVPEHILVGLSYGGAKPDVDALRKIDLAPPAANSHDDYLARLKSSVIPFVEAEYGVDPSFRCIAGVSIGGAFALSALFRETGLFQGAIALSPTTEYFDRWLFRLEEQYAEANTNLVSKLLARRKELPVRIFMAAGAADDPGVVRGIQEFDRQLEPRRYRFFEKQFRLIDGEKHSALKPEGFNRGLRHVFAPLVNLGPAQSPRKSSARHDGFVTSTTADSVPHGAAGALGWRSKRTHLSVRQYF
jgi:dienelactone hydrolase